MKLSVSILKERLGPLVKDYNIGKNAYSLYLRRPVFYSGENIMNSDTLYISTAEKLPLDIIFMEDTS
ncbi:MAG: hypothetical protein AB2401_07330, partial [Bacillus sp. (in: firmicutes)]